MGKAPADQFYYGDWLNDVELQAGTSNTRGVWMNLLARMWYSATRGELSGTQENLAKIANATQAEFDLFFQEAKTLGFCYVSRDPNGIITIRNRRMFKKEKERVNNRMRQQRYYEKSRPNAEPNADLTPPSSSSSSNTNKPSVKIVYPKWLNPDLWKEFKKYRTKIKAPLIEHAEKLCIADLKKIIDQGYKQKDVINQTIMSGKWKSFYPIKNQQPQNTTQQPKEFSLNTPDDLLTPEQLAENVKARKKLKGLTEGIGREI